MSIVETMDAYFRVGLRGRLLKESSLTELRVLPLSLVSNDSGTFYVWRFIGKLDGQLLAREVEADVWYCPQTFKFDVYASEDKKGLDFSAIKSELLEYFC
tara:strand:+ start:189 stop:488 length:300 start_codon:yes stop_codon:yes gene_type:complete